MMTDVMVLADICFPNIIKWTTYLLQKLSITYNLSVHHHTNLRHMSLSHYLSLQSNVCVSTKCTWGTERPNMLHSNLYLLFVMKLMEMAWTIAMLEILSWHPMRFSNCSKTWGI